MDITPLVREGQQIIQSYGSGQFKISGKVYEEPVLVFPARTLKWEHRKEVQDLVLEDFQLLIHRADELDVVLLGTGNGLEIFDHNLRKALGQNGIIIDTMETGAACRTYNVLMAEGRRVAAALMPV